MGCGLMLPEAVTPQDLAFCPQTPGHGEAPTSAEWQLMLCQKVLPLLHLWQLPEVRALLADAFGRGQTQLRLTYSRERLAGAG